MSLLKERNQTLRESSANQLEKYFKHNYKLQAHGLKEESIIFNPTAGTKLKEMIMDSFMLKGVTKKKVFVSWYGGLYELPKFNAKTRRDSFNTFYDMVKAS